MSKYSSVIGLDVHARSVTAYAVVIETGEVVKATFVGTNPAQEIAEWANNHLPGPWHAAYESGCTGFGLARGLKSLGIHCDVIAISTLAKSPKSRQSKTDAADAADIAYELLKPVRGYSCVWIPDEQTESVRALLRLRYRMADDVKAAKNAISSFLLLRGRCWNKRSPKTGKLKTTWGKEFRQWLASMAFDEVADQMTYDHLMRLLASVEAELASVQSDIDGLCKDPHWKPYVDALSAVKGISKSAALAVAAEIGDFSRFKTGRSLSC